MIGQADCKQFTYRPWCVRLVDRYDWLIDRYDSLFDRLIGMIDRLIG